MELLRVAALVAATLTTGLSAGMFYVFSHAIMPGLGRANDRTFVGGFQAIDKAIVNPWFLFGYLGSVVCSLLAAALHLGAGQRTAVLPWLLVAFVLCVAVLVITARVHLPLNAEIKAAGDPDQIADLGAVREQFEATWVRWNLVRTVLSTVAFGATIVALAVGG
jgi:uncharacterized membrane protein